MIPFAILSGHIVTKQNKELEIRVLDLAPDYFTMRLPKNWEKENGEVCELRLSFFSWERQNYRKLIVSRDGGEFEMWEKSSGDDTSPFYTVYCIRVFSETYRLYSAELTREYMHYIELRMNHDSEEYASRLCAYPADEEEDFADSLEEQKSLWGEAVRTGLQFMNDNEKEKESILETPAGNIGFPEMGIVVDNPTSVSLFLTRTIEEYVREQFASYGLENHPYAGMCYKRVYLGNSFCPCLFFLGRDRWEQCISKVKAEGLDMTILIPPAATSVFGGICDEIQIIMQLAKEKEIAPIWQVNDEGIKEELYKLIKTSDEKQMIQAGILMNRRKRDPRSKYLPMEGRSEKTVNEWNGNHSGWEYMMGGDVLFGPFYQTNTATFCTLQAYDVYGDRGRNHRCKKGSCSMPCLERVFLYPKHLQMIGRYNSLFGFSTAFLTSEWGELPKGTRIGINL